MIVSYTLAFPLVYPGTLAHLRLAVTTSCRWHAAAALMVT
jgi:hypothetical protein